MDYISILK